MLRNGLQHHNWSPVPVKTAKDYFELLPKEVKTHFRNVKWDDFNQNKGKGCYPCFILLKGNEGKPHILAIQKGWGIFLTISIPSYK